MSYHSSDRPLPAVVIDHPVQNISKEEMHARGLQIANAAQRILKGEQP